MILARVWQEVSTIGQARKKKLLGKSVFYPTKRNLIQTKYDFKKFYIFRLDNAQNFCYTCVISGNMSAHI